MIVFLVICIFVLGLIVIFAPIGKCAHCGSKNVFPANRQREISDLEERLRAKKDKVYLYCADCHRLSE